MVYYGALSQGCQRCRRRKIKCDEGKPGCEKCAKSSHACPGYRDLNELRFRDESERIIRRAQRPRNGIIQQPGNRALTRQPTNQSIIPALSQPIPSQGANFFFTKYSFHEPPFPQDYYDWLSRSYSDESPKNVLRVAIEAVGLAGISNITPGVEITAKAREGHRRALAAMNQVLSDPVLAIADTTLLAVILLAFFESVTCRTWLPHGRWKPHIQGALAILDLRGPEQFTRERGGQLYLQVRSQIVSLCMQENTIVPPSLVQITCSFQSSLLRKQWQTHNVASPASISEISFRLVNLRAAFSGSGFMHPDMIRQKALEIDADLETWRVGVPSEWKYTVVHESDPCFGGKRHVHPTLWIADAWNNWRTLRILVHQILVQLERGTLPPFELCQIEIDKSVSVIRAMSVDICTSIISFEGTPRIISVIEPLYIVAAEEANPPHVRRFAVDQLRRIDESTGVRQAGVLAEEALRTFINLPTQPVDNNV